MNRSRSAAACSCSFSSSTSGWEGHLGLGGADKGEMAQGWS